MNRNYLDNSFPMDKCAECGKVFMRRCRKDEWGFWAYGGNGLVLFCSSKCTKAYEHRKFMEGVKEVAESKAFAAYKLVMEKHMLVMDAIHAVGLRSDHAITNLKLNRWRELEWLESHDWRYTA